MAPESIIKDRCPGSTAELLQTAALALSVAGLCYFLFYLLAPWIWSQNIPYNPADITPWILDWTEEHDGVEIYALYILMFVNSFSAVLLAGFMGHDRRKRIKKILIALCITGSIIYCAAIGFNPPMNTIQNTPFFEIILKSLFLMTIFFPLIAVLHYLHQRSFRWTQAVIVILLVPVCFIATEPISWIDYSYIFAPALRLLNGAPISDIYFQYDLLPSLLAAAWMKLGPDLNSFQILAQGGYYAAILGVFLLSEKLFYNKQLPLFLVTALILGRIYASPFEVVSCFQVTPLRLDLWLPLVMIVYWKGPYHWSAGLVCGLLILLLKNFGIIYSLAYLQLLITLYLISYFDIERDASRKGTLIAYWRQCSVPVLIIVFSSIASYLIFRNDMYGGYSGYYQKIGIGFIQIEANSFYWYVPPIISMTAILLVRLINYVSPNYIAAGFLLLYCAIGNSIYFFGRSHENNILNISIVLLFLFFLMLDLIACFLKEGAGKAAAPSLLRRHGVTGTAVAMVAVIILSYSHNISRKFITQFRNAENAQLIYPLNTDLRPLQGYVTALRAATGNSDKVYFVNKSDFILYYYGGYTPIGYCNPFQSWIFIADLNIFLQGLLDKGYYLVSSPDLMYLLAKLHYNYVQAVGTSIVVSKLTMQAPKP